MKKYDYEEAFPDINNLEWFYGGGAHIGFWQSGSYPYNRSNPQSIFGIDLVVGVEYTFDEVPFSASLDWKPAFNIMGDFHWWGNFISLSLRYTFR